MLSASQIAGHLESLETIAADFESGASSPSAAFRAHRLFEELRVAYREAPETMAGQVVRLAALRARIDSRLAADPAPVVERFNELARTLRETEAEKEYLRKVLIDRFCETGEVRIDGERTSVIVSTAKLRRLPKASSPERQELAELLKRSGHLHEVMLISAPRLAKAMNQGLFAGELEAGIDALAPAVEIYRVTSQAEKG